MRGKIIYLFSLTFLTFDSCVETFDTNVRVEDVQKYIVVDGLITDQPGPYTINLFTSASLDDELDAVNQINGASVIINDDLNNSFTLSEITAGNYQTSASFRGTVGRTYTLQITTADGNQYESLPQKLLPVGEIEKVYREFVQVEDSLTANRTKDPKNGFNIFLNCNVLPEQNKLVRWRTMGTYEITTYPIERTVASNGAQIVMIPDPPPCSGYSYVPFPHLLGDGICKCCTCWLSIYDSGPILSDPKFINENHVERLKLAFVPANRSFFHKKYYFKVEQMSVTQEAFDFWKKIKKQGGTGSDLFQTPSGQTTGNMKPVGDTKIPVIGLFGVSAVRSHSFFIERSEIPYRVSSMDRFPDSCLKIQSRYNTNQKPDFWN
jgi:hypothetical protein